LPKVLRVSIIRLNFPYFNSFRITHKVDSLSDKIHETKLKEANAMKNNDDIFGKYEDESGEEYYCPVNAIADDHIVSEWELDNCVELSTAGRYSGHLNVADRHSS
jgi:hypothetical protein